MLGLTALCAPPLKCPPISTWDSAPLAATTLYACQAETQGQEMWGEPGKSGPLVDGPLWEYSKVTRLLGDVAAGAVTNQGLGFRV